MPLKKRWVICALILSGLSGCSDPSAFPKATYTVISGINPAEIKLPPPPATTSITQTGKPETILIQVPGETYRTVGAWLRWFWPDDWYISWDVPDATALQNTPVQLSNSSLKAEHILGITDRWLTSLHLRAEVNWTRKTLHIFPEKE